jgi:hypothetical protein
VGFRQIGQILECMCVLKAFHVRTKVLLERYRRSTEIEIENAQKVREYSLTFTFSPASFSAAGGVAAAVVVVGNDWPEDLGTELA